MTPNYNKAAWKKLEERSKQQAFYKAIQRRSDELKAGIQSGPAAQYAASSTQDRSTR